MPVECASLPPIISRKSSPGSSRPSSQIFDGGILNVAGLNGAFSRLASEDSFPPALISKEDQGDDEGFSDDESDDDSDVAYNSVAESGKAAGLYHLRLEGPMTMQLGNKYRMSLLPEGVVSWDQLASLAIGLRQNLAWQQQHRDIRSSLDASPGVGLVSSRTSIFARRRFTRLGGQIQPTKSREQREEELRKKAIAKYEQYCQQLDMRLSRSVEKMIQGKELLSKEVVNLSHFGLGDQGIVPVLALLQLNTKLRGLNLADNSLTDGGVLSLLDGLEMMNALSSLELSRNIKISNRSTTPLLRFLLDNPKLYVVTLEGTRMSEPKREVLYLQAFANRCGKCRWSTSNFEIPELPTEPESSRVRARVEDMARRFQLCKSFLTQEPNPALMMSIPRFEDVWVFRQEFEEAKFLQLRWQCEYKHLEATAKLKRLLREQQRTGQVHGLWHKLVRLYYFRYHKPDAGDAMTMMVRGQRAKTRVELEREAERLENFLALAERHGEEACIEFSDAIHKLIGELERRWEKKERLYRLLRAVTWTIFFARTTARGIGSRIRDLCDLDVKTAAPVALMDKAKDLQVLLARGRRASANASVLALGRKTFRQCMQPIYSKQQAQRFGVQKRRASSLRRSLLVAGSDQDQAEGLSADMRKTIQRLEKAELTSESGISVAEFLDATNKLSEMLAVAASGLDQLMDIDTITCAVDWVVASDDFSRMVSREEFKVKSAQSAVDQLLQAIMYPKGKMAGLTQLSHWTSRLDNHLARFQADIGVELKGAGEVSVSRVRPQKLTPATARHLVLKGFQADVEDQLTKIRAELVVASEALGKPPDFFALDKEEVDRGLPLNVVIALYNALARIQKAADRGASMISNLFDCQTRLGYVTRKDKTDENGEKSASKRPVSIQMKLLFDGSADETLMSLEASVDSLARFGIPQTMGKEIFQLLNPFSFANLKRLFELSSDRVTAPPESHGQRREPGQTRRRSSHGMMRK